MSFGTNLWLELHALVSNSNSQNTINVILVAYLAKCSEYENALYLAEEPSRLYKAALILVEAQMFQQQVDFCISKMLSLMNVDAEVETPYLKYFVSYALLCEIKMRDSSLDILCNYQGFRVLYNNLYSNFAYLSEYGDDSSKLSQKDSSLDDVEYEIMDDFRKISTLQMDILFQIIKFSKCSEQDLKLIDNFFVFFLMNTMVSSTTEDLFNNTKFKLLLSINEQYMIFNKKCHDNLDQKIENKVFKFLLNTSVSQSFIELLFLFFNRTNNDRSLQIMICKLLYLVLTSNSDIVMNFFYLNDLKVLTDVLIREIDNLSASEEYVRNTFLRLLYRLLKYTELSTIEYRKQDLQTVLTQLTRIDNESKNADQLECQNCTITLANKCLSDIAWLALKDKTVTDDNASEVSSFSDSNSVFLAKQNSNTESLAHMYTDPNVNVSIDSLKLKKRPPPPIPRKSKRCM